ncbi:hypothetical protein BH23PLA1_BH23PLA1_34040 [soil metagenome]
MVYVVEFSPDGSQFAIGTSNGMLSLWDAESGRLIKTFVEGGRQQARGDHVDDGRMDIELGPGFTDEVPIYAIAFSPDGCRIAAGGQSGRFETSMDDALGVQTKFKGGMIRIWDVSTNRRVLMFEEHTTPVRGMVYDLEGKRIASIDEAYEFIVWRPDTGRTIALIGADNHLHSQGGYSPQIMNAFSADTLRAASIMNDQPIDGRRYTSTVKLWDVSESRFRALKERAVLGDSSARSVALSPDGRRVILGCVDHTLRMIEFSTGQVVQIARVASESSLYFLDYRPDGSIFVVGDSQGVLRVWDAEELKLLETIQGPEGDVRAVAFRPGSLRVVTEGASLPMGRVIPKERRLILWEHILK